MVEKKLNLYQKLAEIQKVVKGLGQDKSSNSYKYVTGNKVLEHIKPLMIQYGLLLKQEIISIENTKIDYLVSLFQDKETLNWKGKPKSEILSKVMMTFTWIDVDTGEKDINSFGANGQNDWEKGLGSALTYAERYFLLKYFHISTDEDDIDNPERKAEEEIKLKKEQEQTKRLQKINAINIIEKKAKENGWEYNKKELENMNEEKLSDFYKMVSTKKVQEDKKQETVKSAEVENEQSRKKGIKMCIEIIEFINSKTSKDIIEKMSLTEVRAEFEKLKAIKEIVEISKQKGISIDVEQLEKQNLETLKQNLELIK